MLADKILLTFSMSDKFHILRWDIVRLRAPAGENECYIALRFTANLRLCIDALAARKDNDRRAEVL